MSQELKVHSNKNDFLADMRSEDYFSTWVNVKFSNGSELYFNQARHWKNIKAKCYKEEIEITSVDLQFRSHCENVYSGSGRGVYLVPTVVGEMGGVSRECITVGVIDGDTVRKKIWTTPEIIEDKSYEDDVENCFEEALVYKNDKRQN